MLARTVCCRVVVDPQKASLAHIEGREYLVCNTGCKGFIEKASPSQLEELLA